MNIEHLLVAATCVGLVGCDLPIESEDDIDQTEQEIINGVPTSEKPEIGRLYPSGCTATLVRPHIVLTAAHCVGYRTGPTGGSFRVGSQSFEVDHAASKGGSVGYNDLALVRLRSSVPSSFATPIAIASARPYTGEIVRVYGHGCTNRSTNAGIGTKRRYTYAFTGGATYLLCSGDSGGPTLRSNGQLFQVNSGYSLSNGSDVYADVVGNRTWVTGTIGSFGAPPPVAGGTMAPQKACRFDANWSYTMIGHIGDPDSCRDAAGDWGSECTEWDQNTGECWAEWGDGAHTVDFDGWWAAVQ